MTQSNSKIRILLVDDDEDDYLILRNQLAKVKDRPFKLEWIADADKARDVIDEERHDAYLIDYRLGRQDGLELLSKVDLANREEPFIILTGAGDDRIEQRAMKMGIADYLIKGAFDPELLSRVLRYSMQRKHREAQRIDQLIELNRSKDEFIALASHQLRTPATAVKQYLGMVLQGYAGDVDEKQRTMLARAYESNERQINIVNDILRIARLDLDKIILHRHQIDVVELITAVIDDLEISLKPRRQTVIFNKPFAPIMISVDPENFRMALSNLLDNASKYTPDGKTITVTLSLGAKQLKIAIQDEGVGIAAEDFSQLFKKFSRIDNPLSVKVGGNGLGLYWSHEIVSLHGGKISVTSVLDKGTTFTIQLPKE